MGMNEATHNARADAQRQEDIRSAFQAELWQGATDEKDPAIRKFRWFIYRAVRAHVCGVEEARLWLGIFSTAEAMNAIIARMKYSPASPQEPGYDISPDLLDELRGRSMEFADLTMKAPDGGV